MGIVKSLDMVRSGEFTIQTYGNSHCGTSDKFMIRYHLKCSCTPLLDHRGFLFDQLNIQQFFESIKRTQLSCERLTVVCLEQLLEHILTENPTCQILKAELTLSPEPYLASMTHTLDGEGKHLTKSQSDKMVVSSKPPKVSKAVHDPAHQHEPSHKHYIFTEQE